MQKVEPVLFRGQRVRKRRLKKVWVLFFRLCVFAVLVSILVWGAISCVFQLSPELGGNMKEQTEREGTAGSTLLLHGDEAGAKPCREIPVILQNPELPVGCEATAGAMLLYAYGYDIDKETFADALPKSDFETLNGCNYAAHPSNAFIGDPYTYGYGAFAEVVADTMQHFIDHAGGRHRANDISGASEKSILAYIDSGIPVCIWSTIEMRPVVQKNGWYLKQGEAYTNEYFSWPGNEHCMILVGYDEKTVTVYDPLAGVTSYARKTFFQRYKEVGRFAIVLEPA
jgi:uncharacterized protein YvpB